MKAIRSVKNQYRGVNAHLHSLWQKEGGWAEFHSLYIADMLRAMRTQLLPRGYSAALEQSLQIRRIDNRIDEVESDITIFDFDPSRSSQSPNSLSNTISEQVLPNTETVIDDDIAASPYKAIGIYKRGVRYKGEPIVWIELLSPSNKSGGRDATTYLNKRLGVLDSDIVFVEIDYLHELPPTIRGIANYRTRKNRSTETESHPYRILLIEPYPNTEQGNTHIYEFDVDTPIPTIAIPLIGTDVLRFDFDAPYQKTIQDTLYTLERVDYTQLPLNFDRYSHADQTRIVRRMVAVIEAAKNGVDLETAPFEIESLTLEEGLARLEALKTP